MVDEDFVMGYVCGYNDGDDSGGGAFDDVVIAHRYRFGDTPYGIGTIDYNLTERNRVISNVAQWSVYNDDGSYTTVYGPVSSYRIYEAYALLKNDDIIGFWCDHRTVGNYYISYSYANGVWIKNYENIDVFGDCTIIAEDFAYSKVTPGIRYYQQTTVNGTVKKIKIIDRILTAPDTYTATSYEYSDSPMLISRDEFAEWYAALATYGINLEEV